MKEVVLIVIAHSDDESISMAGTIIKHVNKGDKVYVISMTNGVSGRNGSNKSDITKRKNSSCSL